LPALNGSAEQSDVVLAEDAPAEIADQDADLGAEHESSGLLKGGRWAEGGARGGLAIEVLDRLEQVAEVGHVGADPVGSIVDLDLRVGHREFVARVLGDGPLDLAQQGFVLLLELRGGARMEGQRSTGSADGDPGGELPVDEVRGFGGRVGVDVFEGAGWSSRRQAIPRGHV